MGGAMFDMFTMLQGARLHFSSPALRNLRGVGLPDIVTCTKSLGSAGRFQACWLLMWVLTCCRIGRFAELYGCIPILNGACQFAEA